MIEGPYRIIQSKGLRPSRYNTNYEFKDRGISIAAKSALKIRLVIIFSVAAAVVLAAAVAYLYPNRSPYSPYSIAPSRL